MRGAPCLVVTCLRPGGLRSPCVLLSIDEVNVAFACMSTLVLNYILGEVGVYCVTSHRELCFGLALGCVFTPVVVVAGGPCTFPGHLSPVPQLV